MPVIQIVNGQLPWPLLSSLCADISSVWPSPINYPDHLYPVYVLIFPLYDRHQSTKLTICVQSMCWYFLCMTVTSQLNWPFLSSLCADISSVWPSPVNYPDHLCPVYVLILPLYDRHQWTILIPFVQSMCWYFLCMSDFNILFQILL
jgi:hypothetical protein